LVGVEFLGFIMLNVEGNKLHFVVEHRFQLCLNWANASIYLAVVEDFSYFICRNCMVGAVHSISSLISIILIL
jgi:hypothetical protein